MQFKYAQKSEDGGELFEKGEVLARQFLGEGQWEVWDLRPVCDKWCQSCSSKAERIVRHNNGPCPLRVSRRALGEQRAAARQRALTEAKERHAAVANNLAQLDVVSADDSEAADESDGQVSQNNVRSGAVARRPRRPAAGDSDSEYQPRQSRSRRGAARPAPPTLTAGPSPRVARPAPPTVAGAPLRLRL